MIGCPKYLSHCSAVRSNGSSTALEASIASKLRRYHESPSYASPDIKLMIYICIEKFCNILIL